MKVRMNYSSELITASRELRERVEAIRFSPPVAFVYNPLRYAWEPHKQYLEKYGASRKKIVFLGMNPGPWGMTQTGVPFGEVRAVKEWLGISGTVDRPVQEHPLRPVNGFACPKSEVSGRRLWGLFHDTFGKADAFFKDHFVANYCPLLFLAAEGKNITPDKLQRSETEALFSFCDSFLVRLSEIVKPEWVIGIGAFAKKRAAEALAGSGIHLGNILHPSPASPAANINWKETATRQLKELGVWK